VAFEELLERADVVSLHCPLTPATRGLMDAPALARMKPTALLVNTARGPIVDGAALLGALEAGRIGGAGLDVLDTEPPPAEHPLVQAALPNLIVTPHVAWASREARQRLVQELARNIEAFREGRPRNVVAAP
jgi:glycerate dehydrogenase